MARSHSYSYALFDEVVLVPLQLILESLCLFDILLILLSGPAGVEKALGILIIWH